MTTCPSIHQSILAGFLAVFSLAGCSANAQPAVAGAGAQPAVEARSKPVLHLGGLTFRDLDANGELDPYEDWRLDDRARAADLVKRMTVAEKVGTLMHSTLPGQGGQLGAAHAYDFAALGQLVNGKHVTSFITRLSLPPAELAEQNNKVQELAEASRLGIPITISTDPRNHFQYVLGASAQASGNTQWPELLGFGALGDAGLVRRFGEIARREYRALGIHMALSPQLDLASEPRWARGSGTFGSDAFLTSRLGAAYVAGFQGSDHGLAPDGVMTVVKHWVGYGAEPEGFDAHNYYGRIARPGGYLPLHIEAFRGALAAKTASIMPAYPILAGTTIDGQPLEQVGPGFNKQLIDGLLRGKFAFDGIVLSDWAITRDCNERCRAPTADAPQRPQDISTAWGVGDLSVRERYVKGLQAGLDQFGGTDDVAPLLAAVASGEVKEARLDESVMRIMLPKFRLGLFDDPYVDPARAAAAAGSPADFALAAKTQREAQVLLKDDGALPLKPGAKVWLFGIDADAARKAGFTVVGDPAEADVAIVRTGTPSEMLHPYNFFGRLYHEGRLDFRPGDAAYDALAKAKAHVPTVLAIFMDRPAVLTSVEPLTDVILANFGASDAAVLDVLTGKATAKGYLPFELPRSMAAVEAQDPAAPDDSADPLYPHGAGIVR
jgi:beta-glucosidase